MAAKQKDEAVKRYEDAKKAGAWMVAVWSVQGGEVRLYRQTSSFPVADMDTALDLLKQDLQAAKGQKDSTPPV